MQKDHLQYDVRKVRIYKDMYRPSSSLSHFFGTLVSILFHGQSQVGGTGARVYKRRG